MRSKKGCLFYGVCFFFGLMFLSFVLTFGWIAAILGGLAYYFKGTQPMEEKKKNLIIIGVAGAISFVFFLYSIFAPPTEEKATQPETQETISTEAKEPTAVDAVKEEVPPTPEYSLSFDPEITYSVQDSAVSVDVTADCPDGTILQISTVDPGLTDLMSETLTVTDKKVSCDFTLTDTSTREMGIMVMLQFNAEGIVQPQNVKDVFGDHGEKLTGKTSSDATFADGMPGKNAYKTISFGYPSDETLDTLRDEQIAEVLKVMKDTGEGAILDASRGDDAVYRIQLNNEWYLSTKEEKQYLAETILSGISKVNASIYGTDDDVILRIYDESMNEVAKSKILGGMKVND